MIVYQLTRSKRKTLSLRIEPDLTVSVRAPLRTPKGAIDRFVQDHEAWIERNKHALAGEQARKNAFHFDVGNLLPVAGRSVALLAGDVAKPVVEGLRLVLPADCDREEAVVGFLRELTEDRVREAVGRFAPGMGVEPTCLKVTSARTRWASCSGKNSLCFSYRTACLPGRLLDYIVVHELAHIRQHNHSRAFWAVVETVLPDWPARRAELREFGTTIPF